MDEHKKLELDLERMAIRENLDRGGLSVLDRSILIARYIELTQIINGGRVYCIWNVDRDAVKIGFSKNPERRLLQLRTGCPDCLVMWCHLPGSRDLERTWHKLLTARGYHFHREWFDASDDFALIAFMHGSLDGGGTKPVGVLGHTAEGPKSAKAIARNIRLKWGRKDRSNLQETATALSNSETQLIS